MVARVLSLRARKKEHLVKVIARIVSRLNLDPKTVRDTENREVLHYLDTIRSFLTQTKVPNIESALNMWKKTKLENIYADAWESADNYLRRIPGVLALPLHADNPSANGPSGKQHINK